jgi:hypothetical protein
MVSAIGGPEIAISVVEQGGQIAIAPDDYVATFAAIATVGPAHGHAMLASERAAPRATCARLHLDFRPINEQLLPPDLPDLVPE